MSPACDAEPPVTLAAIRLVETLPGSSPPNASCVTLPIGPTGVTFVSPETRRATMARTLVSRTAASPISGLMPKRARPVSITATVMTAVQIQRGEGS